MLFPDIRSGALPISAISRAGRVVRTVGRKNVRWNDASRQRRSPGAALTGTSANLATHNGRALTGWTASLHSPTLTRSLGVAHARTGDVTPDVTIESPFSLGSRNTLGNATGGGRNTRTASGLCQ